MSNDIVLTGTHGWLGSRLLYSIIHGLPDYPETMMPKAPTPPASTGVKAPI